MYIAKSFGDINAAMTTFKNAAKVLYLEERKISEPSGVSLETSIIPAIVLDAFSCELALKSLAAKRGISVERNHLLDELFDKLPQLDKNNISEKVIEILNESRAKYGIEEFNICLQKVGKTFVDWRYYYENYRRIDLLFFVKFSMVVEEYVKSL